MMVIGIISVVIILSILCAKSCLNNQERLIFMIKHISYVAVYIALWTFPFKENLREKIDKNFTVI